MRRKIFALLLTLSTMLTLCGCLSSNAAPEGYSGYTVSATAPVQTEPSATIPPDGNASDVTCKGSYTSTSAGNIPIANVGDATLTNEALWVWYWAAVAQYQQEQHETAPDFSQPLDSQPCEADASVNSWQQYFLRQALTAWHSAQALSLAAQTDPIATEAAYQPNGDTHARCMTGMPATEFLYGYNETYEPNSLHQAYLDAIPEQLAQLAQKKGYSDAATLTQAASGSSEDMFNAVAKQYNYAYSYLTYLSYELEPTLEETEAYFAQHQEAYAEMGITQDSGYYVDIHHILLIPSSMDSEISWTAREADAQKLLKQWENGNRTTEGTFAELAYRNSQDTGTAATGGAYHQLQEGQLPEVLDDWCFDPVRKAGDTAILRSELGIHILYFSGSTPIWQAQAKQDATAAQEAALISQAKARFPMEVTYSAITLAPAEALVSYADILYPDIAHERYPEVPLYLQQDYPQTKFGADPISTHGCGITTMSMLTTYMTDEEWTPPEMCAAYGRYSYGSGTDGMIFINEPPALGYFFRERAYDPVYALEALKQGLIVVSIQSKGYWTSGGHYLLLEKLTEDGMVQVRDSNIVNYGKLEQHKEDKHAWGDVWRNSTGYWIFEPKNTRIAACSRCGSPDEVTDALLSSDYQCEKCEKALIRRNTYLSMYNS